MAIRTPIIASETQKSIRLNPTTARGNNMRGK